jgi:hypothetical protein
VRRVLAGVKIPTLSQKARQGWGTPGVDSGDVQTRTDGTPVPPQLDLRLHERELAQGFRGQFDIVQVGQGEVRTGLFGSEPFATDL